MPNASRTRRFLALATDNWPARGYLAVVAASLAFFLYAVYLSPDPGFAAIWPYMTTAPLSILAFLVPTPEWDSSLSWLSPLIFSAGVALSGLVNAALIGLLARALRTGTPHPTA
ncbi:SCO4225 family membrane protein [Streptomyces sp. NPDC006012]|uniref:SCO4225 family membrane protein n=1 Tax=Streptomyces sp. NPDC006012 TaxID=3364739 RepID=UPI00367A220D